MKKLIFGTLAIIVMASSCKKKPEACIDGPTSVKPGSTHTFTYCGDKTPSEIEWQDSQGNSYTGESVDITFPEYAYEATITLDVMNKSLGVIKKRNSATHYVTVSYGANPSLHIKARDYLYDQGFVSAEGLANASVKIYSHMMCFKNETASNVCLVAEATADANGNVIIEGLDPNTSYIVDVEAADFKTNWASTAGNMQLQAGWAYDDGYGGYQSMYDLVNPFRVDARISPMPHLIRATEWVISNLLINGVSQWASVNICSKDNTIKFDKNLNWTYSEGVDVCTTDGTSSGTFSWVTQSSWSSTILDDYSFSMVTTNGPAAFSSGQATISNNKLTLTSFSGGNTIESVFTRL